MGTVQPRYAVGLALCLMLVVGPASAQQQGGGGMQAGGTAYYTFARPGQNTIEVLVLGGGRSGIYEIGENIDLGKLMALAGGGGGSGGNTKVTVSLFRRDGGERTRVLRERLNAFAERSQYPALQEGDLVRIEVRRREPFGWRDVLRISTAVTSLTFTVLRVFDIGR